jgi:hypothetical protein
MKRALKGFIKFAKITGAARTRRRKTGALAGVVIAPQQRTALG